MSEAHPSPAKSADDVSETDLILNLANPDAKPDSAPNTIDPRWRKQYDGMRQFRDYLLDRMSQHTSEAREIQPDVLQDEPAATSASDLMRDYLLAMNSTEQETLYEVEAALRRIEDGTYGVCELTGKPIPPERLAAIPWTRFTVEAQQEVEARNDSPVHARLGTLPDEPETPDVPSLTSMPGRETSEPPPPGTEKHRA